MAESLARLCASGAGTSSAGKGVENGASGDIARPVGGRALTFRWLLELENLVRGIHGGRPRLLLAFPAARSLTLSPWTPKIWPLEANGHLGLPRTAPKFPKHFRGEDDVIVHECVRARYGRAQCGHRALQLPFFGYLTSGLKTSQSAIVLTR